MKIGVVGCGALGSFYGAQLCRAGHEVHFLARSDYEVIRRQGVRIRSVDGDFQVQPSCAREPETIGPCELVLIGLKTTANHRFSALVPPLVGPATPVITLQNGLGNEAALARLLGEDNVLGGLCFVCLNRVAPGEVVHTAHGRIVLGEYHRTPSGRTHYLASLFRAAAVPCELTPDLERAHWEKLIWNIPFNGLGVAGAAGYEAVIHGRVGRGIPLGPCLTTEQLLGDSRWEQLARELMLEVIDTGNALGYPIPRSLSEENIARTRCMGAYKASTLVDFERRQPLELESLFLEPLRQARRAGIPTPRLAALAAVLAEIGPEACSLHTSGGDVPAFLSPHPAPLPKGEGDASGASGKEERHLSVRALHSALWSQQELGCGVGETDRAPKSAGQPEASPLPQGEGEGEGEGDE